MPSSRIPSPARSQGARSTPRRYKPRPSRSLCSPARSNNSIKLSAVIRSQMDSFVLSPMPTRRSVLADTTDIEVPRRRSWWRKLGENSREIMEVLNNKEPIEDNNAIDEYIEVDVLSQEKKNYTFDLPDSSDSESISSIVIPQRKLFTQKENQPQNKFGQIIHTRESLAKLHKSQAIDEKALNVGPKNLFNQGPKPRSKPIFPSALLNISTNKTMANKTKEQPSNEEKGQIKSLFGNKPGTKRKNMFADFIVSESEDEMPVFVSQNKLEQKRKASLHNHADRESSPPSITDIEMDDWRLLPSSTMVDHQLEEGLRNTPSKRARLEKLSEAIESNNTIVNKTKQSDKLNLKNISKIGEAFRSDTNNEVKADDDIDTQNQTTRKSLRRKDTSTSNASLNQKSLYLNKPKIGEALRSSTTNEVKADDDIDTQNQTTRKSLRRKDTSTSNASLNQTSKYLNKPKIGEALRSATTNEVKADDDTDTQNQTTRKSLKRKDTNTSNASLERSARKEIKKTIDKKNASQVQTLVGSVHSNHVAVKNDSKNIEAIDKSNQTKTRSKIDQALQSEDDEDDFTLEYDNDDDPVKEHRENETITGNKTQNSQHWSKIDKDNNQQSNISKGSQKSLKEQKDQADKNEEVKNYNDEEGHDAEKHPLKENFVTSQNDSQEIENVDRTDKDCEDDQESVLEERGQDLEEQEHAQTVQENNFEEQEHDQDDNQPDKLEEHLRISPSKKAKESNTTANKTIQPNESLNLKNNSKNISKHREIKGQDNTQKEEESQNYIEEEMQERIEIGLQKVQNNNEELEVEYNDGSETEEDERQKNLSSQNKDEEMAINEENLQEQEDDQKEQGNDVQHGQDNKVADQESSQKEQNDEEREQEHNVEEEEIDLEEEYGQENEQEKNVDEHESNQEEEDDLQEHNDDDNNSGDDIEVEANASYQAIEDDEHRQDDSEVEDDELSKIDESEEEIEQDHDEGDAENEEENNSDQYESQDVADGETHDSAQNMSQDVEEGDEEVENEPEVEDDEEEDEENTNDSEKNVSQDAEDAEERHTNHENEKDENEPDNVEEIADNDIDPNDEQNDSQDEIDNEIINNDSDGDDNNGNQSEDDNEEQISRESTDVNITHDTTGRHRKKHESKVLSPEAILHEKTSDMVSFVKGRNTSVRKTKSMIKNPNIRPSLAPASESTGLTDGSNELSAEGSGWDSHRTTRVTLRKTFGKDFTPRKSLRTLVMEKSAKRQTVANLEANEISKHPQANSTERLDMHDDDDDDNDANNGQDMQESDHEASRMMRQTTLENYLQKIKQQNADRRKQLDEEIRSSLQKNAPRTDVFNYFKVPAVPKRRIRPLQSKPKAKPVKSVIPLDMLPPELLEDMKYKPPKRYRPANASWVTKHLYNFLEKKLQPKYDYKARVRSEKLVETIYNFTKDIRRQSVAPSEAVNLLKLEMARLDVVKTHFEFYEFFHEFMPREVRVKVVPDVFNNISLPKHGVFSDILR